jgi:hypothetical protein
MAIDMEKRESIREWLISREPEMWRYLRERAVDQILLRSLPKREFPSDALPEFYDFARERIGNQPLHYLEFGVFSGRSISQIAQRFTHPGSKFVGFDSFEGIPEPWKGMPQGTFTRRGNIPALPDPRIRLIQGWFQNTLPSYLMSSDINPASSILVHYDADLYSSTLFVMTSLWHKLEKYYFIFDEFMSEEIVAMRDFCAAYPVDFEFYAQTNAGGYPTQIFGKMERRPLVPKT